MVLYSQSRKVVITNELKIAKSILDKFFGLLIKSNPSSLLFKTRFGIHTFFLKKPIDVLVLSSSNKVVKAKTVKPNSIFVYNPKYATVIELPQNTIKKTKTEIGDNLVLKN